MGYHYVKYWLPTGPIRPSSHDLPWLSKPLVYPIYTTTDLHKLRASIPPSHRCHVTLVLHHHSWHNAHTTPGPLGTIIPFSQHPCNTHVTTMTDVASGVKSGRTRSPEGALIDQIFYVGPNH